MGLKDFRLDCVQAGFCHEVRLRFDSARPTGCAGGLAGARRNGRPGNSPLRRAASLRAEMY
jgi:hypothetical protein